MIPVIVAGIIGAGIGAIVALNWDEIKSWLTSVICKVKELWQKYKPYVKKVASIVVEKYIENGHPMVRIMYRLFFQDENTHKWNELQDLPTREIEADELPPFIQAKLKRAEQVDITNEMQRELKLTV